MKIKNHLVLYVTLLLVYVFPVHSFSSSLKEQFNDNNPPAYNCSGVALTEHNSIISCEDFSSTEDKSQNIIVEIYLYYASEDHNPWDNTYFECNVLDSHNNLLKIDCGRRNRHLFKRRIYRQNIEFPPKRLTEKQKTTGGKNFRIKFK